MAQFAADTFAGLGSGASLNGRTASDGSSIWTTSSGGMTGDGAGGVFPTTGGFVGQLTTINNNVATQNNQVITWDWVPAATPGVVGLGWATAVWVKVRNAQFEQGIYAYFDTGGGTGFQISLSEADAYGGFNRQSTFSPNQSTLVSTIHCTLTISAGVVTLVCTGGISFTTSLNLSICAGFPGAIGLSGYNPSSVMTPSVGVHTSNIVASNTTTVASSYNITTAFDVGSGGGSIVSASNYPSVFNIVNDNVGNAQAGYGGTRFYSIALNGIAPAGGFIWTPATGRIYDNVGVSHSRVTIPANSDGYEFAYASPLGTITNTTITGTNTLGFSNPSITQVIKGKICFVEGDSISDPNFGTAPWVATTQTGIGATWYLRTSAAASSLLDDGTMVPSFNIKVRYPITVMPFKDFNRTQDAVILWGGTNDLYDSRTPAASYASLQNIVSMINASGFTNIAVVTCLPRDASGSAPGQTVWEAERQTFNALIRSGYGAAGADSSVTVLDIGNDPTIGTPTAYMNTAYYPDNTHPYGAAAVAIISNNYMIPWINGLPSNQTFPQAFGLASITGISTIKI